MQKQPQYATMCGCIIIKLYLKGGRSHRVQGPEFVDLGWPPVRWGENCHSCRMGGNLSSERFAVSLRVKFLVALRRDTQVCLIPETMFLLQMNRML